MSRAVIVRYQTTAEAADENQRLVEQVYAELNADAPDGLRYMTFRLADQTTFVHVAVYDRDDRPLERSPAFAAFQAGLKDRLHTPPDPQPASVVGSYRF